MPAQSALDRSIREISRTERATPLDYGRAPFLAIWEVTRACDLACIHCRASAIPSRDSDELTLEEARLLFERIHLMGTRLLVLTGGDPVKRPDIFELIRSAKETGLDPSLSPSVTPLLTREALRKAREAGASAVSLSLDGGSARTHDDFRGVPGAFDRTLAAAMQVKEAGLELRINTTVTRRNLLDLRTISQLVEKAGARVWSVFFLVPTGRAEQALQITPGQCETVLRWLYDLSCAAPYRIKTTEAPHYRRVVLQAMAAKEGRPVADVMARTRSGKGRFMPGMNDGRGFVFISHRGDVYPSGFFPLPAGNVRKSGLESIYRDNVVFQALRRPDLLHGKCGLCGFRDVCGGSRARAFATSGDVLGEDPLCAYVPARAAV